MVMECRVVRRMMVTIITSNMTTATETIMKTNDDVEALEEKLIEQEGALPRDMKEALDLYMSQGDDLS